MKFIRCILTIALLSIILTGCADKQQSGYVVRFYYCTTESSFGNDTGLFAIEERRISYNPNEYRKLIEEYLNGAINTGCTSPFPGGTTLVDFTLRDGRATILLSPHMVLQPQANVITCCACLCKTLFELPDIDTIVIAVDGAQINGEDELTFQKDSFSTWDDVSNSITPHP